MCVMTLRGAYYAILRGGFLNQACPQLDVPTSWFLEIVFQKVWVCMYVCMYVSMLLVRVCLSAPT